MAKTATYRQYDGSNWVDVYFKTSASQVGESSTLYFLRPATHTVNGKSFYGTTHQGITLYASDIKISSSDTTTVSAQLAKYLPLSGGTLTGNLTIGSTSATKTLTINGSSTVNGNSTVNGKLSIGSSYINDDNNDAYFVNNVDVHGELSVDGSTFINNSLEVTEDVTPTTTNVPSLGTSSKKWNSVYSTNVYADYIGKSSSYQLTLPEKAGTVALTSDIKIYNNATTSVAGLMSSTDKSRMDSMWSVWSADGTGDTLINKVEEVLNAFASMTEGADLATLLSNKLDKAGGTISGNLTITGTLNTGNITVPDISADNVYADYIGKNSSYRLALPSKTGTVALTSDIPSLSDYATQEWVTNQSYLTTTSAANTYLKLSGGTLTGDLSLGTNKITALTGTIWGLTCDSLYIEDGGYITYTDDSENTYEISLPSNAGTIALTSDVTTVYTGTTTPTGMKTGDIWIYG